ncbi:putative E3 ubiquitin-protein ligase [Chloropicon primus]|uniref:Zinc finger domain-containing protein n=1 Tax=Chloropicon primus TaxID=1764295 RepID=A0A5B8MD39_9CHLO|nr:zinc finger domain-containing protein [Chloropicon primus]UPQ97697.1 putative E3 ubiquitin-protein ligase [Chloropicon primus]|eukprot:QDZ18488.1 zinc finger domain-containing protein [Chloropicon primus]
MGEVDFVVDLDSSPPSSSASPPASTSSYGCRHYRRKCALVAPCCGEVFTCRLCHDEAKDTLEMGKRAHTMDRKAVTEVVCLVCNARQGVSNMCVECGAKFGEYYCEECRLFDDTDKGQYHCSACGICRVGGRENFFHCFTCGACFSVELREEHKCIERNLRGNCPICFEELFTSTKQITILNCGHPIHKRCFLQMRNQMLRSREPWQLLKANTCPTCSKSTCDLTGLWEQIDREVEAMPMPEEYRDTKVSIICNDCNERDDGVAFHILALKCSKCGSYNTRRV